MLVILQVSCQCLIKTSVSETIRKTPLVKTQTALKTNKTNKIWQKTISIWRMEFLHRAVWHDHDFGFARWLHPAMWHVALESWQWIHEVAAPCSVIRGSGITCHGIRPVAAPCNVTRSSGSWHWVRQVAAPCNVAGGSGMTTSSSQHVILHQSAIYSNRTTLGKKWRHVDFQDGGSQ